GDRDRAFLYARSRNMRMTEVAITRSRELTSPRRSFGGTTMMRDQLFDALSELSPAQLNSVVFKLAVPRAILPGPSTAPGTIIIEALHWAEQQGRLDDVARLLVEVSAPAPVTLALDEGPASSLRQAVDDLDSLLLEHRRAVHRPPEVVKQTKDRIE